MQGCCKTGWNEVREGMKRAEQNLNESYRYVAPLPTICAMSAHSPLVRSAVHVRLSTEAARLRGMPCAA